MNRADDPVVGNAQVKFFTPASQMKKFGSYGIYLGVLLLLLLGAAATYAQGNVGGSAFRGEWEAECLIDDLPSADERWGAPVDPHLTLSCRPSPVGAPDTEVRSQIDPTTEITGDQKGGKYADENAPLTNLEISTTDGSCLQAGEAGTRPRCAFPTSDPGLVRPKYFTASEGDENDADGANSMPREKFNWGPAIVQSLTIQGFQHAYALTFQEKTRRALRGPFFRDYIDSVKGLSGWDDGNRFFTNYIAHPAQGAMTGFIFIQNHDRVKKQKFGESKQYWMDRLTAFAWSTAWSTNWELGPISQSSIGNLGMHGAMGYVDLVITPTVGTGWLVAEEAVDRFFIRHIENQNFLLKISARMFLNPMRSVANLLRFRQPWYRDRPFGR